ncbi:MAG: hypothetical protein IJD71_00325 [Clostridia bacterium]|nr:hypothetical protein [Clostridia bacterium]
MENLYIKKFNLRTSDFDCRKKILPSAVLDLFQTVAGEHATALGCGFDALFAKNLLWVLVRTRFEIIKQPDMYQAVTVKTWPLAPSRIGFQREYLMEDDKGNPLIKSSSDWVVIDSKERKIVAATNVYPQMEHLSDKCFEDRSKKLPDFEAENHVLEICPKFSEIDMNNHVNNTKYANYVLDALNPSEDFEIRFFQIDYRHELCAGDSINVFVKCEENISLVKGVSPSGENIFVCKIQN